jgi:hypothetical protein
MEENALLDLVRRLISMGRLPTETATRVIAGYGDGRSCDVCEKAIPRSAVVYVASFGSGEHALPLSMHYDCFVNWDRARTAIHSAARATAT